MTKFSNKLKKTCFWPILGLFSQFWDKKNFSSENPALSRTTSYEFLAQCQISEKTYHTITRKCLGRRTDGRMDRPYFIGLFRLPPRVQKLTDMKTYIWTQDQHCHLSMLVPQIEYLYYPLNVEGVTQTDSLLRAHKGKTNNNNIKIYICQSQFSVLLDKNKNQLKLLFSPLVPPNFWN